MANNRMMLVCRVCEKSCSTSIEYPSRSTLCLAKFYPHESYWTPSSWDKDTLNAWLEFHDHGACNSQWGQGHIEMEYEITPDGQPSEVSHA